VWQKAKKRFTFDLLNPFKTVNITYNNQKEGDCNMAAQQNYTPELTATIVDQYQNGATVEDIAASIDKSIRSVRSKLVREGVYVAQPKAKSTKVMGPTKKELLRDLEGTGFDVSGFEGATKEAITRLIAMVN
jgi:transposase-like protein